MDVFLVALLCLSVGRATAVIYRLNATEYNKFPPLYHLDDYESCLTPPDGVYCHVQLDLLSDEPSTLLAVIQDYSKQLYTHFNHTNLEYGVCVTQRCKKYTNNIQWGPKHVLEACLNDSLWDRYRLKVKVSNDIKCKRSNEEIQIETIDIAIAVILLSLFMCSIVGSLSDIYMRITEHKDGYKLLQAFSIIRNCERLIGSPVVPPDKLVARLKGLNGIRTLTTMAVILGHSPVGFVLNISNPLYLEQTYDNWFYHIVYNGTLIVQSFFIVSSFLLTYSLLSVAEKKKISWYSIPRVIILRWLRLTPSYAIVIAFTCTWLRFLGDGPLWQRVVMVEYDDCRRYWWSHLLYFNNYMNTQCMAHAWYLAADMQLYAIGVVIFVFLQYFPFKFLVLGSMFLLGLFSPTLHTYLQDIDAMLLITPEVCRHFFSTSENFNLIYKRGHTNLACFIIGMVLGYWIYNLQKTTFDIQKYKKYRLLYWCIFPIMVSMAALASVFYEEGPRNQVFLGAVYSTFAKPMIGALVSCIIFGMVFKYEKLYRYVLEWRGWEPLNRLSYSAYLIHVLIIRISAGTRTTLLNGSFYLIILNFFGVLVMTYVLAAVFWLLVEAPSASLIRIYVNPRPSHTKFEAQHRADDNEMKNKNNDNM